MAYPVSSRWDHFTRRGFHPVTRVDVRYPGEGVVYSDLPVSSGSISFSRRSAVRASGQVVIPDPDLFPGLNDDSVISPYGAELLVYTGTLYPEGAAHLHRSREELQDRGLAEFVPMGVFTIWDGDGSERQGNVTTLEFYDRGRLIDEKEHIIPHDYGGESAFVALNDVLTDPDPFLSGQVTWQVHIDPSLTDIVLPAGTVFDASRWDFATKVAEALGAEVYFGRDGDIHVVPVPGITEGVAEHDWLIDASPDGVLADIRRKVSRPEANGVVIVGSTDGDSDPPWAFVVDDNPISRSRYGGPLGKVVKRFVNSNLTTDAQCDVAALAKLRDKTGLQRSVEFDTFANPAMDPGDVSLLRSLAGGDEFHLVDGYRYDFRSAAMPCTTRSIQYVE